MSEIFKRVVSIVGISVMIAIGVNSLVNSCSQKRIERKVSAIEKERKQIIDTDSLRDVIESRILDSLKVRADRQDAKVAEFRKQISKTGRRYETLEKRFDSLRVFMPDF